MTGQPILVTGAIRSGTTWVGRMIAKSPSVGYIHEPLNPWETRRKMGICGVKAPSWYYYINEQNGSAFHAPFRRMLAFRYNLGRGLMSIRSRNDLRRVWQEYHRTQDYRARHVRPLVKDPFAIFSAEWLAETFDAEVVMLIRHPAAFAGSIKRVRWGTPFQHLLSQPALVSDYLEPFEGQLREYENQEIDIIDQAILTWRILYHAVKQLAERHPDWIFLRHKDIAQNPEAEFSRLFSRLDLAFTSQIRSAIREHSAASNPAEVPVERPYALRRDSSAVIGNWKRRLSAEEIGRIRAETWDVAQAFYSDDDW